MEKWTVGFKSAYNSDKHKNTGFAASDAAGRKAIRGGDRG
jgi:hypothetical protein